VPLAAGFALESGRDLCRLLATAVLMVVRWTSMVLAPPACTAELRSFFHT